MAELIFTEYEFYSEYCLDDLIRTGITIGMTQDDQVKKWWGNGDYFMEVDDMSLNELYNFILAHIDECDRGEGTYTNEELLRELLEFIKETDGFGKLDMVSSDVLQA